MKPTLIGREAVRKMQQRTQGPKRSQKPNLENATTLKDPQGSQNPFISQDDLDRYTGKKRKK